MFLVKRVFGISSPDPAQPELVTIDQGQLFLARPDGIKGSRECIFIDASIAIRRTSHDFTYQLVVTRTFQEGEDQLLEEDAENLDERAFLLDPDLHFALSSTSFTWLDPDDDAFEFLLPVSSVSTSAAQEFERLAWRCMWERKHRQPWPPAGSQEERLADRSLADDFKVTAVAPLGSPAVMPSRKNKTPLFRAASEEPVSSEDGGDSESATEDRSNAAPSSGADAESESDDSADDIAVALGAVRLSPPSTSSKVLEPTPSPVKVASSPSAKSMGKQRLRSPSPPSSGATLPPPPSESVSANGDNVLVSEAPGSFFVFDKITSSFMPQAEDCLVQLFQTNGAGGKGWWMMVLNAAKGGTPLVSLPVDSSASLQFDRTVSAMPFNYTDSSSSPPETFTFLFRFPTLQSMDEFEAAMTAAIYENKWGFGAWKKLKDDEKDYNTKAWLEEEMEGIEEEDEEASAPEEEQHEDDESEESDAEDYESDEDERERKPLNNKTKNSQLAVGYKEDLSFVVQGDMIGVFKQQREGGKKLKFVTSIVNISSPDGKKGFTPSKVMLHNQDTSMILQNPLTPGALYRLDLETGKVVDEYKVSDTLNISSFLPDSKFAPTTQQQTFIGLSHNGLFRVDPRLSGNKLVESEFKQYATKNDFSVATTTESGRLAVASNKGDIRLFDKLGKIAKTILPALGDPIIGLDATADGRWVLATTKSYIMLIDTLIPEGAGRYGGSSGFDRSFPADKKPTPKVLQLKAEHIAHMNGVSFTPAKFNSGLNETERTIVSSSGPFIIAWNFRHVKAGNLQTYTIRRYSDTVIADQFKFGGDREIIVTLPGNVLVEEKKKLKAATRDSMSTIVNAWEP